MEDKAKDACLASIEILNTVKDKMAPGVLMGEIFETAVHSAKKLNVEEWCLP